MSRILSPESRLSPNISGDSSARSCDCRLHCCYSHSLCSFLDVASDFCDDFLRVSSGYQTRASSGFDVGHPNACYCSSRDGCFLQHLVDFRSPGFHSLPSYSLHRVQTGSPPPRSRDCSHHDYRVAHVRGYVHVLSYFPSCFPRDGHVRAHACDGCPPACSSCGASPTRSRQSRPRRDHPMCRASRRRAHGLGMRQRRIREAWRRDRARRWVHRQRHRARRSQAGRVRKTMAGRRRRQDQ